VGALQVNCYILGSEATKEVVVIDPGSNGDKIIQLIDEMGLKLKYIINTHAHFDHIGGNAALHDKTGAKIIIHEEDSILLDKLSKQADVFGYEVTPSPPADILVKEGDTIEFGDMKLDVIHTPGHTPGGISLKIDNIIFTGDTLFNNSIGRTDLPGGSFEHIIYSIKEKLFCFDDGVKVYPGHGGKTTIGNERKYNPYFSSLP
jgi:glyoxylase-like metal-dependent hydrolase (beta-lactamase superfamily II)